VLCADDFGLTEGVSRGILELARQGRISATSAMTNCEPWPDLAPALAALGDRIGVGLHLNLTTGAPLGSMPVLAPAGRLPPLTQLLRGAVLGRIPQGEVRAEIERQLDAFERCFGVAPAFVDGHQHTHVLPVVRRALLSALAERRLAGRLWLRDPSDAPGSILRRGLSWRKALIVRALAAGFRRDARAAGFATNEGFAGFSPLDGTPPALVFRSAFRALGPRPVVMCHPGYADEALRVLDPAVESRPAEMAYLVSADFAALLAEHDVALVPSPL
jgi:chitin disaccharide deacetylase